MADQDADDGVVAKMSRDIGWQALGPAIVFAVLSTSVVALRWYTRCRLVRCVGWDDYVILLSLLLSWASTAVIAAAVAAGIGLIDGSSQPTMNMILIVTNNNIWALTVNVTKASILMQYLRVFSGRTTRILCYTLLVCLLPSLCWAIFGGTFLCNPIQTLWSPQLEGSCRDPRTYWLSVASADISLDFMVLLLPMPAVVALRLPRKQKATLVLVFLLGFSVCAVSLARLASVLIMSSRGHLVESGIWAIIMSTVEANVGIVCACLLALRPLVVSLFPKLMAEEEGEVPSHSMQIRTIANDGSGNKEEGRGRKRWRSGERWASVDENTLVTPTTPSTMKSQGSSMLKRFSTAGTSPTGTDVEQGRRQSRRELALPMPPSRDHSQRPGMSLADFLGHGGHIC